MKRKVKLFLGDIIENMKMAEDLTSGIEYQSFITDKTRHYAVLRCIEIIGEAAKHISEEIRSESPMIPWKEMAGMRDKVIHFYMGIDFDVVWQVVTVRYPLLRPEIEDVFSKTEE
ncbi:MAG: DUF86 domain-containing protein [Chitinivibrionales bacterium]|nr:DUF86 domain-containing protein [Chitinivibrionales bacterium]